MASQRSFLRVSGYRLELTISTGDTNPVRFLRERLFGSSLETEIAGGTACRSGKLCAQHRKPGVDDQSHRGARLGLRADSGVPMPSAPRFFESVPPHEVHAQAIASPQQRGDRTGDSRDVVQRGGRAIQRLQRDGSADVGSVLVTLHRQPYVQREWRQRSV